MPVEQLPVHTTYDYDQLRMALGYIKLGWAIFPCRYHGKEPLTRHGFLDATVDERVIRSWWQRWPEANIGIRCGAVSGGVAVLDIDGPEGKVSISGKQLPVTPTALTGNNGLHYYYRSQRSLRPQVGLLPHVDLRAEDSYVIAPRSIHPNGKRYAWSVSPHQAALAPLPLWVYETNGVAPVTGMQPVAPTIRDAGIRSGHHATVHAPAWRYLLQAIPEGKRNATLTSVAGWLRLYHPLPVVAAILQVVNLARCIPPLEEKEISGMVRSVFQYAQPGVNGHPRAAVPRYEREESNHA
jgi:hypothetical protein